MTAKVKVYKFHRYDIKQDRMVESAHYVTDDFLAREGGVKLPWTELEVDHHQVNGLGMLKPEHAPKQK